MKDKIEDFQNHINKVVEARLKDPIGTEKERKEMLARQIRGQKIIHERTFDQDLMKRGYLNYNLRPRVLAIAKDLPEKQKLLLKELADFVPVSVNELMEAARIVSRNPGTLLETSKKLNSLKVLVNATNKNLTKTPIKGLSEKPVILEIRKEEIKKEERPGTYQLYLKTYQPPEPKIP